MQENSTSQIAERLEFVDALRGFALLGVFAANLLIFSGFTYMSDEQRMKLSTADVDRVVHVLELVFIENKFMGLFSILFGVSFWLFLGRSQKDGPNKVGLFYSRLAWLFVIGAVHGWLFWAFDILRFYALWGLLLPLFIKVSNKILLSSALFFALLAPALIVGFRSLLMGPAPSDPTIDGVALQAFSHGSYSEFIRVNWLYDWYLTLSIGQIAYQLAILGRLLLGLYAARALNLSDLEGHKLLFRGLLICGGAVGIGGNIVIFGQFLDTAAASGGFILPLVRRIIAESGYLGLSVAYAFALALIFQTVKWRPLLLALAPVGRMALTCYLFQTLIGLWLFYGFMPGPHLMGRLGPAWLVAVWVAGYALQIWLSSVWLRYFRFGPAEWLWRSLTYWKVQPFKRPIGAI